MVTIARGEEKTSANGKDYLRLSVRVGEGDAAQWVTIVAFDPEAITIADSFDIDACVYVEGRISISEWTGNDGAKRHGLSVMSWHCRNRPKRDKRGVGSRSAPSS
jgi:single-stranded DNA-binding protein